MHSFFLESVSVRVPVVGFSSLVVSETDVERCSTFELHAQIVLTALFV